MPLDRLETSARVADRVFDSIHAAIMSGEIAAGERLRIRDLSAQLGTSVMPVREAIRRLEELGLAEAVPYRGAVVREFTPDDLMNIYAVRRLLEVDATVRGAHLYPADGIPALDAELSAMRAAAESGDVIEYLERDEAFLSLIYAAAGNPVLVETIRILWTRCRTYKTLGVRHELETGNQTELLTHQDRLLRAVAANDPQRAGRITEESLDAATRRISDAFPD